MNKDDSIYLNHVLEQISNIENSTKGISKEEFVKNIDVKDAVIRRIEIIGEAVKNISEKIKRNHENIAWKKIAGTRDILIHAYFSVDLDLVWDILKTELPKLKKEITVILAEIKKS